jgi:hypothetical protein
MLDHVSALKVLGSSLVLILGGLHVVRLLDGRAADMLPFKQAPLEGLGGVEENLLRHEGLLVLEHLLVRVPDKTQLVDVDLGFVLKVLEHSEDTEGITDADIVLAEPGSEDLLLATRLTTRVLVIVQPEHAGDYTSRVIDYVDGDD